LASNANTVIIKNFLFYLLYPFFSKNYDFVPLPLSSRYRYLPVTVIVPLPLSSRYRYRPVTVIFPLPLSSVIVPYRYRPVTVIVPLPLSSRYRYLPVTVIVPLPLSSRYRYLPVTVIVPLPSCYRLLPSRNRHLVTLPSLTDPPHRPSPSLRLRWGMVGNGRERCGTVRDAEGWECHDGSRLPENGNGTKS
jgi:hypothetical protein